MQEERIFRGFDLATGTHWDGITYGFAALFGVLLLSLLALRGRQQPGRYHNGLAWLRAVTFFSFCLTLSSATGVMQRVLAGPWLSGDKLSQPAWWLTATLFLGIVVHGYAIAWPKGTYVENRQHYWTAIPFGVVWGVSEAQLHLSSWALLEETGLSTFWLAVVQIHVMAVTFPWHVLYWDRYISPAHNILEWNPRKVLMAHLPNTITATVFLAVFRDASLYVAIEAISLIASAYAQRFPPPWKSEWHGAPILKEGGKTAAELGLVLDGMNAPKPASEMGNVSANAAG